MNDEQSLLKEREKVRAAARKETDIRAKRALVDEDEMLRQKLATHYAMQDPIHANARAEAMKKLDNFRRYGSTSGPRR
jgi:homoserine kinase